MLLSFAIVPAYRVAQASSLHPRPSTTLAESREALATDSWTLLKTATGTSVHIHSYAKNDSESYEASPTMHEGHHSARAHHEGSGAAARDIQDAFQPVGTEMQVIIALTVFLIVLLSVGGCLCMYRRRRLQLQRSNKWPSKQRSLQQKRRTIQSQYTLTPSPFTEDAHPVHNTRPPRGRGKREHTASDGVPTIPSKPKRAPPGVVRPPDRLQGHTLSRAAKSNTPPSHARLAYVSPSTHAPEMYSQPQQQESRNLDDLESPQVFAIHSGASQTQSRARSAFEEIERLRLVMEDILAQRDLHLAAHSQNGPPPAYDLSICDRAG